MTEEVTPKQALSIAKEIQLAASRPNKGTQMFVGALVDAPGPRPEKGSYDWGQETAGLHEVEQACINLYNAIWRLAIGTADEVNRQRYERCMLGVKDIEARMGRAGMRLDRIS